MLCKNCNGDMLSDGYRDVYCCENASGRLRDLARYTTPDDNPIYCVPLPVDGDTLTTDQIRDGWHYCPAFDGLLTQGEGDNGTCFCNRDSQTKAG